MGKFIIIFLFTILLFSCTTLNYKFSEKISKPDKISFDKKIRNSNFPKKGILKGVYTEQSKSYNFEANYDLYSSAMRLKFFTLLDGEIIFDVRLKDGEKYYDSFDNTIFSVKIGYILDKIFYCLDIYPDKYELYLTKDDYMVAKDNGNYLKYDENARILKKENYKSASRYFYNDSTNKLSRIEFSQSNRNFILVFNNTN